jgi:hypothetical protein
MGLAKKMVKQNIPIQTIYKKTRWLFRLNEKKETT